MHARDKLTPYMTPARIAGAAVGAGAEADGPVPMIRLAIIAAALKAISATLLTALLLVGTASARAETNHGALTKAYGMHDLDRAPNKLAAMRGLGRSYSEAICAE